MCTLSIVGHPMTSDGHADGLFSPRKMNRSSARPLWHDGSPPLKTSNDSGDVLQGPFLGLVRPEVYLVPNGKRGVFHGVSPRLDFEKDLSSKHS